MSILVVYACKPSTWELKDNLSSGQSGLLRKFQTNLKYKTKSNLKKEKPTTKKTYVLSNLTLTFLVTRSPVNKAGLNLLSRPGDPASALLPPPKHWLCCAVAVTRA